MTAALTPASHRASPRATGARASPGLTSEGRVSREAGAGSLAAALTHTTAEFIAARAVMGIGGAEVGITGRLPANRPAHRTDRGYRLHADLQRTPPGLGACAWKPYGSRGSAHGLRKDRKYSFLSGV